MGVRRAFGLPVVGRLIGLTTSPACDACRVAALPLGEPVVPTRPRLRLDSHGEHILCCNRWAVTTRRHNAIAYALVRCARRAGCEPRADNRAVMDGGYVRPGDVYLNRWMHKAGGMAIDVTLVSKWVRGVDDAEAAKHVKYKTYLADYEALGFTAFALDLGGGIGKEAWTMLTDLARMTAMQPQNYRTRSEALNDNISEIAWTFVDEVTREIQRSMRPHGGTRRMRSSSVAGAAAAGPIHSIHR